MGSCGAFLTPLELAVLVHKCIGLKAGSSTIVKSRIKCPDEQCPRGGGSDPIGLSR